MKTPDYNEQGHTNQDREGSYIITIICIVIWIVIFTILFLTR